MRMSMWSSNARRVSSAGWTRASQQLVTCDARTPVWLSCVRWKGHELHPQNVDATLCDQGWRPVELQCLSCEILLVNKWRCNYGWQAHETQHLQNDHPSWPSQRMASQGQKPAKQPRCSESLKSLLSCCRQENAVLSSSVVPMLFRIPRRGVGKDLPRQLSLTRSLGVW